MKMQRVSFLRLVMASEQLTNGNFAQAMEYDEAPGVWEPRHTFGALKQFTTPEEALAADAVIQGIALEMAESVAELGRADAGLPTVFNRL